MTKKIAVINDLSGFGKCSLTAAIPVISVMGVQPCPLPTAVLSAQTGYPSYYLDDYTDKMEYIRSEWEKLGAHFDGIYTGFVASEAQIDRIFEFLETFRREDTFLLVDPVMGDDGVKYDMFTDGLLEKMKALACQADVVTPNLTELCLLTEADYETVCGLPGELKIEVLHQMADSLLQKGAKHILVTGIHLVENGEAKIGNLIIDQEQCELIAFPYIGGSYSGTGDLFASIIAGGVVRGDSLRDLCMLAGRFVEAAMRDSAVDQVEEVAGTEFEQHLGMLLPKNITSG
ncbi:pyridoxamine kinase [Dorea sp. AM58-8]|uniref:pyridoxamine kinase n=1 Tax=Dorea sp. AM58-8 TaxID=2292346 RepID=UPI000E472755|nr:pyridoxamine kinase [Dorea sp. AM58-8]RGY81064.1 pyridoxamine kinase [Dorea sp. AM58-8]